MNRPRSAMARVRRHVRRRVRRELSWLLVATGIAGLVLLDLDVWPVPDRHRWDAVAAAVALAALGLVLLAAPGARARQQARGPGRRRRTARHR